MSDTDLSVLWLGTSTASQVGATPVVEDLVHPSGRLYNTAIMADGRTWMTENYAHLPSVSGLLESTDNATPYYYVHGYTGTNVNDAKYVWGDNLMLNSTFDFHGRELIGNGNPSTGFVTPVELITDGDFSELGSDVLKNGNFTKKEPNSILNGDFTKGGPELNTFMSPAPGGQLTGVTMGGEITDNYKFVPYSGNKIIFSDDKVTQIVYGGAYNGDTAELLENGDFTEGTERVTNGDFLVHTGWTPDYTATINDGSATIQGLGSLGYTAGYWGIRQSLDNYAEGKSYKVTFKAKQLTGGGAMFGGIGYVNTFNQVISAHFVEYTYYQTISDNESTSSNWANVAFGGVLASGSDETNTFEIKDVSVLELGKHWNEFPEDYSIINASGLTINTANGGENVSYQGHVLNGDTTTGVSTEICCGDMMNLKVTYTITAATYQTTGKLKYYNGISYADLPGQGVGTHTFTYTRSEFDGNGNPNYNWYFKLAHDNGTYTATSSVTISSVSVIQEADTDGGYHYFREETYGMTAGTETEAGRSYKVTISSKVNTGTYALRLSPGTGGSSQGIGSLSNTEYATSTFIFINIRPRYAWIRAQSLTTGQIVSINNVSITEHNQVFNGSFDFPKTNASSLLTYNFPFIGRKNHVLNNKFENKLTNSITNGDFGSADMTGWGVGSDNPEQTPPLVDGESPVYSNGGGRIRTGEDNGNSYMYQNSQIVEGKSYKLSWKIRDNINTNSLNFQNYSTNSTGYPQYGLLDGSEGSHSLYFVGSDVSTLVLKRNSPNTDIVVTDISLEELGENWVLSSGWSIGDSKLIADGTQSGYVTQTNVFLANTTYKISCTVEDYVSGYSQIVTKDWTAATGAIDSNGYKEFYINTGAISNGTLHFYYGGDDQKFIGSITNLVVEEAGPVNADFTDVNIDFTNGLDGWIVAQGAGATAASIAGDQFQLICAADSDLTGIYQEGILTAGKYYKVTADVESVTGECKIQLGNGMSSDDYIIIDTAGNDQVFYRKAVEGKFYILRKSGEAGNVIFNSVVVEELGADWVNYISTGGTIDYNGASALINIDSSNNNIGIYSQKCFKPNKSYKIVVNAKRSGSTGFGCEIVATTGPATVTAIGTLNLTGSDADFTFYYRSTGNYDLFIHRKSGETDGASQTITINSIDVIELGSDWEIQNNPQSNATHYVNYIATGAHFVSDTIQTTNDPVEPLMTFSALTSKLKKGHTYKIVLGLTVSSGSIKIDTAGIVEYFTATTSGTNNTRYVTPAVDSEVFFYRNSVNTDVVINSLTVEEVFGTDWYSHSIDGNVGKVTTTGLTMTAKNLDFEGAANALNRVLQSNVVEFGKSYKVIIVIGALTSGAYLRFSDGSTYLSTGHNAQDYKMATASTTYTFYYTRVGSEPSGGWYFNLTGNTDDSVVITSVSIQELDPNENWEVDPDFGGLSILPAGSDAAEVGLVQHDLNNSGVSWAQQEILEVGKYYKASFNVFHNSTGAKVGVSSTTTDGGAYFTSTGVKTHYFKAIDSRFRVVGSSAYEFKVGDVSVIETGWLPQDSNYPGGTDTNNTSDITFTPGITAQGRDNVARVQITTASLTNKLTYYTDLEAGKQYEIKLDVYGVSGGIRVDGHNAQVVGLTDSNMITSTSTNSWKTLSGYMYTSNDVPTDCQIWIRSHNNEAAEFYIDNVSIREVGGKWVIHGAHATSLGDWVGYQLIPDPTFTSGIQDWSWDSSRGSVEHGSPDSTLLRLLPTGTNGSILYRTDLLTIGSSHKVVFKARGTKANGTTAQGSTFNSIGDNGTDWSLAANVVITNPALTATYQDYEFHITPLTVHETNSSATFRLYLASTVAGDIIEFDDIYVYDYTDIGNPYFNDSMILPGANKYVQFSQSAGTATYVTNDSTPNLLLYQDILTGANSLSTDTYEVKINVASISAGNSLKVNNGNTTVGVLAAGDNTFYFKGTDPVVSVMRNTDGATSVVINSIEARKGTESNYFQYGVLYNYAAVVDSGFTPAGWSVPTKAEYTALEAAVIAANPIDSYNVGYWLKSDDQTLWEDGGEGGNESGFTALPAGSRSATGDSFKGIGKHTFFWTQTAGSSTTGFSRNLWHTSNTFVEVEKTNAMGMSVRLIKDA